MRVDELINKLSLMPLDARVLISSDRGLGELELVRLGTITKREWQYGTYDAEDDEGEESVVIVD